MKYRKSRQRDFILDLLRNNPYHPSADWIYRRLREEMPRVSLGTVYRNLGVLAEQGAIRKISFGEDHERFEANTREHYHFICERCREIRDLSMPVVSSLDKRAASFAGQAVKRHRIEFYGICDGCLKRRGGRA